MSASIDIGMVDGIELAKLVRRGDVTALELLEATIERIERLNPVLNAVITNMYDEAKFSLSHPLPDSPLAGVPFLLKDFLAEYANVRFTEGSKFLQNYVPDEDSELVRRYKAAGLVFVGKTNTPEFAVGPTTEPRLFGPTRNPWNTDLTPGGSSGGAAASVAARIVPIAHGNDAGGSIRLPAACCGVFGLKPTRGRNPLGPHYGDVFSGLVSEHVLTMSVRDSAAVLDATSAPDVGDPYIAPTPSRTFLEETSLEPKPLKIAFSEKTLLGTELHLDCRNALKDAANLCSNLGHQVEEANLTVDGYALWEAFTTVLAAGFAWSISDWSRKLGHCPTSEDFEPFVWAYTERGRQLSASDYLLAVQDLQRFTREIAKLFQEYDVWLTPTLGEPPLPLGTFSYSGGDPFEVRRRMTRFSPFAFLSNVTGQPAMSVPLFWNDNNLPLGSHFMGKFGDEATLFRLASQLETARPWMPRKPPVSA